MKMITAELFLYRNGPISNNVSYVDIKTRQKKGSLQVGIQDSHQSKSSEIKLKWLETSQSASLGTVSVTHTLCMPHRGQTVRAHFK